MDLFVSLWFISNCATILSFLILVLGGSIKIQSESEIAEIISFFNWLKANKLESLTPPELTKEHIWKYRVFLSRHYLSETTKKPLKRSTQNYYLIALRAFLAFFAEKDIPSLPPEKVKLPREKGEKTIARGVCAKSVTNF